MPATNTMLARTVAALLVCICLHELYARYRARNLPPGLAGLWCPFKILRENPWLKMLQFNRKCGCAKIAADLLDKRGINYADRPRSVMAGELAGHAVVAKLHEMIEVETRRTLRLVLEDPDRLQTHVRNSITLRFAYITKEGADPLVELAELANSQLSKATTAGAYHVDIMPFLQYVPSWVPGAGFKKTAAEYAVVAREALETPHKHAVSQLAAGTALPSLSSCLLVLSMPDLTEELEDHVKWTTLTLYRGGVDTSSSLAYSLYLAMMLHPRVMKKMQQELDSAVVTSRLPTFADRPSLPYLEALFTELFRWHAPGPI
ncbi:cytochrome P450, partial [Imleria badia]